MKDSSAAFLGGVLLVLLAYAMWRAGQPGPASGSTATVRAIFGGRQSSGDYAPIVGLIGGAFLYFAMRSQKSGR